MDVLSIEGIHVRFDTPDGEVHAVRGVDLNVGEGETVAVVGESGSGKSQIMMAVMGLLAENGHAEGRALYRGEDLLAMRRKDLNRIRGKKITMIFQEPMTSLDPLMSIGAQLCEPLRHHGRMSSAAARARAVELLRLVQLPEPEERFDAYPHELSGGQRQRVMIAMALSGDPDLLIADEPTTALDVTIQADILRLLASLKSRIGMSILFITHDLGIVEAFADRTYVMQAGKVVEQAQTSALFSAPRTEYTRMLLDAEPSGTKPEHDGKPVLDARVSVSFPRRGGLFSRPKPFRAVDDIALTLHEGQTLGVVGESGSGKSTLGRAVLRLLPSEGRVAYLGRELPQDPDAMRAFRSDLQMVFQDPYGSLSPRMTVGEIVAEGLLVHAPSLDRATRTERVKEALAAVGLDATMRNRFPHEFSGGQRQRIAIARAIILRPRVVVLDEPTSALDRSVQSQVVELLRRLQMEFSLSYIFISHDLSVVRAMSDRVLVMKEGRVVEEGPTESIFREPQTEYTRALLASAFNLKELLRA